jgi:hypothetical protein
VQLLEAEDVGDVSKVTRISRSGAHSSAVQVDTPTAHEFGLQVNSVVMNEPIVNTVVVSDPLPLESSPKDSVSSSYVAIVPSMHKSFVINPGVTTITFETIQNLHELLHNLDLAPTVKEAIILLPSVKNDYRISLDKCLKTLGSSSHVQFSIVPPPPSLAPEYGRAVDLLLSRSTPNVRTRLEHNGRSILSYGFIGESLNQHEAKAGEWTRAGLQCIRKFLSECLSIKWIPSKSSSSTVPVIRRVAQCYNPINGPVRRKSLKPSVAGRTTNDSQETVRRVESSISSSSNKLNTVVHHNRSSRPENVRRIVPHNDLSSNRPRDTRRGSYSEQPTSFIRRRVFRRSQSLDPVRLSAPSSTYRGSTSSDTRSITTPRREYGWFYHRRDVDP